MASRNRTPSPLLAPIVADTTALQQTISLAADCFLHGDCHTDNILIDDEDLVWIDWQGAGGGSPAAELAFPSIRATPNGATLPQDDMIYRYATSLGLDVAQISRAVLAAELAIFLFTWPEYATYNTCHRYRTGPPSSPVSCSDLAQELIDRNLRHRPPQREPATSPNPGKRIIEHDLCRVR